MAVLDGEVTFLNTLPKRTFGNILRNGREAGIAITSAAIPAEHFGISSGGPVGDSPGRNPHGFVLGLA